MNPSLSRGAARLGWITCWVALSCACSGSSGGLSVAISPTTAVLAPGGTQQFAVRVTGPAEAARASVTFSASGGAVSPSGFFTAPSAPGLYQVVARSVADSAKGATATVTVSAGGACPSSAGEKPTGSACAPTEGGNGCAGALCLALNANLQNQVGICSQLCTATCGVGEVCVALGNGTSVCGRACAQPSDCCDGFICVPSSATGPNVCFVAVASADCGACITVTNPADIASVCDTSAIPNAGRACDACSANPSPSQCVASPGHPDIFCCP